MAIRTRIARCGHCRHWAVDLGRPGFCLSLPPFVCCPRQALLLNAACVQLASCDRDKKLVIWGGAE
jgi:hypothetical protein